MFYSGGILLTGRIEEWVQGGFAVLVGLEINAQKNKGHSLHALINLGSGVGDR